MIYRCTRNVPLAALDPEQFRRVKDFFAHFEATKGEHPGLYQTFDTSESFEKLLYNHLQKLLLDYSEQKGKPVEAEVIQTFIQKIPDNLPRRAPFFGRDREMEVVMRTLSPEDRTWGRLLDGIGGIGKSALAVEAAHRAKERAMFDAFLFVSFIFQEARKELTTNDETALCALSFFVPSASFEAWSQVSTLSRNALETTIDRLSTLSLLVSYEVEEKRQRVR